MTKTAMVMIRMWKRRMRSRRRKRGAFASRGTRLGLIWTALGLARSSPSAGVLGADVVPSRLSGVHLGAAELGEGISAPPCFAQWRSLILSPECELNWSFDDLTGARFPF
eukprot:6740467-Pyramimonas_sp.AAC.1